MQARSGTSMQMHRMTRGVLLVAAAAVTFSFLPILFALVPFSQVGLGYQVLSRLLIGAASLLLWNALAGSVQQRWLEIKREHLSLFLANGLVLFLAFTTYNLSIGLGTPPAKAILLVFLHPVLTMFLGKLFLGETLSTRRVLAALGGVTGLAIALKIWQIANFLVFSLGDLFALANGLLTSLILIIGRRSSSLGEIRPLVSLQFSLGAALLWAVLLGLILAVIDVEPLGIWTFSRSPSNVLMLLSLGLVGTTLPYILLYSGLQHVEASISSFVLMLEPMSIFILQFLILGQPVTQWQLTGGTVLFLCGYLVRRERLS